MSFDWAADASSVRDKEEKQLSEARGEIIVGLEERLADPRRTREEKQTLAKGFSAFANLPAEAQLALFRTPNFAQTLVAVINGRTPELPKQKELGGGNQAADTAADRIAELERELAETKRGLKEAGQEKDLLDQGIGHIMDILGVSWVPGQEKRSTYLTEIAERVQDTVNNVRRQPATPDPTKFVKREDYDRLVQEDRRVGEVMKNLLHHFTTIETELGQFEKRKVEDDNVALICTREGTEKIYGAISGGKEDLSPYLPKK